MARPAVLTSLSQKSKWNPCGSTPSMVKEEFEYESNCFVFFNPELKVYVYYKIKGLTTSVEADVAANRKVAPLPAIPPVLVDGYLLLTKKRVIRLSKKHILKRKLLAINAISIGEFENEFLRKSTTSSGARSSSRKSNTDDTFFEAPCQVARISERKNVDVVMEDQIESLLFARDSQALGRLSDIARTRSAIKGGTTGDTDDRTE